MRVLFLTIGQIPNIVDKSVHIDLIKELVRRGHDVSVLCTRERRLGLNTEYAIENTVKILRLRIGNITKCSMLEKGVSTILIEQQFKLALKKYFNKASFDLVIYNTPPITLANVVKYCKKKYKCRSYLMLKDIFPQNALDLGVLSKSGLKGLLYKYFRLKEKELYKNSDRIGCMSRANINYLIDNNPQIKASNVELFPNAVYQPDSIREKNRSVLEKYGINTDYPVFIYGGNLGKPQGLDYLIDGIKECRELCATFLIVGGGSEKERIFNCLKDEKNVKTINYLPSAEYKELCAACDVGMIFLDKNFTIPNYPSRVLSYLESAMPIIACTDTVTDIRELVEEQARCGKWCKSENPKDFYKIVKWMCDNRDFLSEMGKKGRLYLEKNFMTEDCVKKLEDFCHVKNN